LPFFGFYMSFFTFLALGWLSAWIVSKRLAPAGEAVAE
jgi:hypothetical protein